MQSSLVYFGPVRSSEHMYRRDADLIEAFGKAFANAKKMWDKYYSDISARPEVVGEILHHLQLICWRCDEIEWGFKYSDLRHQFIPDKSWHAVTALGQALRTVDGRTLVAQNLEAILEDCATLVRALKQSMRGVMTEQVGMEQVETITNSIKHDEYVGYINNLLAWMKSSDRHWDFTNREHGLALLRCIEMLGEWGNALDLTPENTDFPINLLETMKLRNEIEHQLSGVSVDHILAKHDLLQAVLNELPNSTLPDPMPCSRGAAEILAAFIGKEKASSKFTAQEAGIIFKIVVPSCAISFSQSNFLLNLYDADRYALDLFSKNGKKTHKQIRKEINKQFGNHVRSMADEMYRGEMSPEAVISLIPHISTLSEAQLRDELGSARFYFWKILMRRNPGCAGYENVAKMDEALSDLGLSRQELQEILDANCPRTDGRPVILERSLCREKNNFEKMVEQLHVMATQTQGKSVEDINAMFAPESIQCFAAEKLFEPLGELAKEMLNSGQAFSSEAGQLVTPRQLLLLKIMRNDFAHRAESADSSKFAWFFYRWATFGADELLSEAPVDHAGQTLVFLKPADRTIDEAFLTHEEESRGVSNFQLIRAYAQAHGFTGVIKWVDSPLGSKAALNLILENGQGSDDVHYRCLDLASVLSEQFECSVLVTTLKRAPDDLGKGLTDRQYKKLLKSSKDLQFLVHRHLKQKAVRSEKCWRVLDQSGEEPRKATSEEVGGDVDQLRAIVSAPTRAYLEELRCARRDRYDEQPEVKEIISRKALFLTRHLLKYVAGHKYIPLIAQRLEIDKRLNAFYEKHFEAIQAQADQALHHEARHFEGLSRFEFRYALEKNQMTNQDSSKTRALRKFMNASHEGRRILIDLDKLVTSRDWKMATPSSSMHGHRRRKSKVGHINKLLYFGQEVPCLDLLMSLKDNRSFINPIFLAVQVEQVLYQRYLDPFEETAHTVHFDPDRREAERGGQTYGRKSFAQEVVTELTHGDDGRPDPARAASWYGPLGSYINDKCRQHLAYMRQDKEGEHSEPQELMVIETMVESNGWVERDGIRQWVHREELPNNYAGQLHSTQGVLTEFSYPEVKTLADLYEAHGIDQTLEGVDEYKEHHEEFDQYMQLRQFVGMFVTLERQHKHYSLLLVKANIAIARLSANPDSDENARLTELLHKDRAIAMRSEIEKMQLKLVQQIHESEFVQNYRYMVSSASEIAKALIDELKWTLKGDEARTERRLTALETLLIDSMDVEEEEAISINSGEAPEAEPVALPGLPSPISIAHHAATLFGAGAGAGSGAGAGNKPPALSPLSLAASSLLDSCMASPNSPASCLSG